MPSHSFIARHPLLLRFKRQAISVLQKALLSQNFFLTASMAHLYRERILDITDRMDYVRMAMLELFAYEVKVGGIVGDVAEVGVYRGDFAQKIHEAFPDRILHLFDTFEGFDARDKTLDLQHGFHDHHEDFSKTSVAAVLKKMRAPSQCRVHVGRFPDTALGLEQTPFVFVSLDADLYLPILAGLRFFYPKLSPGGLILVHDFAGTGYKGVREAVLEFCQEQEVGFVPLCDVGGSVAITKGYGRKKGVPLQSHG